MPQLTMKCSINDPHVDHGSHGGVAAGSNKRRGSSQQPASELQTPQLEPDFDHDKEHESDLKYLLEDELIIQEDVHRAPQG